MPRKRSFCKHAGNSHLAPSCITGSACGNANQGGFASRKFYHGRTYPLTAGPKCMCVRRSYGSHFQCQISLAGTEPLGTLPLSGPSGSCDLGLSLRRTQNFEKSPTQCLSYCPSLGLLTPRGDWQGPVWAPPGLWGRC